MKSGFYYDCRMDHFRRYLEREPAVDIADRMQVIRLPFSTGKIRAGMDVYRQFCGVNLGTMSGTISVDRKNKTRTGGCAMQIAGEEIEQLRRQIMEQIDLTRTVEG